GLRFAPPSGAPVTARAIRYSIERALSPKLGTPRPAAMYLRDLSGIHVRGDRISFTLRARSPDFLERLSLPYYCTVPPDTPIVNRALPEGRLDYLALNSSRGLRDRALRRRVAAALDRAALAASLNLTPTASLHPDPSSFLVQMLGHDVPVAWLPASTRAAVA